MDILCKVENLTFSEYVEMRVAWSGDTLPVCPHCHVSLYDVNFNELHDYTKQQGGAE